MDLPFLIDYKYFKQCGLEPMHVPHLIFHFIHTACSAYVIPEKRLVVLSEADALNPMAMERVVLLFYLHLLFMFNPFFASIKLQIFLSFLWISFFNFPFTYFSFALIILYWFRWKGNIIFCLLLYCIAIFLKALVLLFEESLKQYNKYKSPERENHFFFLFSWTRKIILKIWKDTAKILNPHLWVIIERRKRKSFSVHSFERWIHGHKILWTAIKKS